MAEFHRCDRCGRECHVGTYVRASVLLANWQGEPGVCVDRRVELRGDIQIDGWEEKPDLCSYCIGEVLAGALEHLRTERARLREAQRAADLEAQRVADDAVGGGE